MAAKIAKECGGRGMILYGNLIREIRYCAGIDETQTKESLRQRRHHLFHLPAVFGRRQAT